jgi:hypothetical protein
MAENMELQTFKNELTRTDITPSELQKLAENKSVEILQKINATTERIAEAKQEAESARDMKTGWFGKTEKKATATANAVVVTNVALAEMNNLVQESIRFTCSSIQFAQVMHKTMAFMMVNGFKGTDGRIIELSRDSQEAVQSILDEADDFVTKQLKVEMKQEEMHQRLDKKDKFDEEQNQRLEKLKNIFEAEREKVTRCFDKNDKVDEEQNQRLEKLKNIFEAECEKITRCFDEKDKVDKKQFEQLENLQKLMAEKKQFDEKQENEIRLLVEYTKQKDVLDKEQSENIQKTMDELKSGVIREKVALILSIVALVISVGTLAFFILRLYL